MISVTASRRAIFPATAPRALACAVSLACAGWAGAQPADAASASASASSPSSAGAAPPVSAVLPPVVITGNPLRSEAVAAPVSSLSGHELVMRRGASLGETLNGLPGVSSSYFGPNANRPIVRGLDGDRVRILGNGGASVDASSLSFDHAVPVDPLIAERVEVLRGPGALLYGGSAMGGVVNTIDNRIPVEPVAGPTGSAELRLGGAERERGGAAVLETGTDQVAVHVDVFGRETSDLRVPRHVPVEDGVSLEATSRVRNSASRTRGGAVGGAWFFDGGRVGVSLDTYDSRYGIVAEPDVTIRMQRDQLRALGEYRPQQGPWRTLRAQMSASRYEHREIEGSGEVGTTFKSEGAELRLEAEHAPLAGMRGLLGVHLEDTDFSALGEEAFVPSTRTRKQALFVLEERAWAGGAFSAGLRLERAEVASAGDTPDTTAFGAPMRRDFGLRSASASNAYAIAPGWTLTGAFSLTERAPTSFELYANGLHAATGVYERGDPTLDAERGRNLDLALEWKGEGANRWRAGAYLSRFSRFIALEATGTDEVVDGEAVPLYAFRGVRARMHGVEIEGRQRVLSPQAHRPLAVDLTAKVDLTRGVNADTGEALPRLAPVRALMGFDLSSGLWAGRVEVDHAAAQRRVPSTDRPTDGWTQVHLAVSRRFDWAGSSGLWFVKLSNLGDELAYSATTSGSIRDLAPMPGRALKTGLRLAF